MFNTFGQTIPAGFVWRHELYNYFDSNGSTKVRPCYLHSSFEKEILLRKYTNKSKFKEFDDHVVMLGKWKQIMNEVGFVENQAVKLSIDDSVLTEKGDVVFLMQWIFDSLMCI